MECGDLFIFKISKFFQLENPLKRFSFCHLNKYFIRNGENLQPKRKAAPNNLIKQIKQLELTASVVFSLWVAHNMVWEFPPQKKKQLTKYLFFNKFLGLKLLLINKKVGVYEKLVLCFICDYFFKKLGGSFS